MMLTTDLALRTDPAYAEITKRFLELPEQLEELGPVVPKRMFGGAGLFLDGLMFALALGVLVSYMVLASQFNSFIHPVLVLMALPFSVTGAVVALVLGQQSLNMFSMIGLVLLMGLSLVLIVKDTSQLPAIQQWLGR